MSLALEFLGAVLARLRADEFVGAAADRIRLSRRTPVDREDGTTIDVIPGDELPEGRDNCDVEREMPFTVSIFVRNDDPLTVIDPIIEAVLNALNPRRQVTGAEVYPSGGVLTQGALRFDEEIADADAVRADISLKLRYRAGFWSREAPTPNA